MWIVTVALGSVSVIALRHLHSHLKHLNNGTYSYLKIKIKVKRFSKSFTIKTSSSVLYTNATYLVSLFINLKIYVKTKLENNAHLLTVFLFTALLLLLFISDLHSQYLFNQQDVEESSKINQVVNSLFLSQQRLKSCSIVHGRFKHQKDKTNSLWIWRNYTYQIKDTKTAGIYIFCFFINSFFGMFTQDNLFDYSKWGSLVFHINTTQ